jgi:hypothetical protein
LIFHYAVLSMIFLNLKIHPAGLTSFLLVAASLLGFSYLMPTAATASPSIDGTTIDAGTTPTTSAAESNNSTATNTTIPAAIVLSQEPLAVGHYRMVSGDMTDQTQPQFTFEGSTTITLPNSAETIITQDTAEGTFSTPSGGNGGSFHGHIHMTTEDGSETATTDFTEFSTFESSTSIGLAYFSTNSTDGRLAPLNNMIAVYLSEGQPNEEVRITFFEWIGGNNDGGASSSGDNSNNNSTSAAGAAAVI